jgi:23S rRNA G2445 N2-methylase RlmL
MLLTNPPYGERIGERAGARPGGPRDLRDLYASLGTAVRDQLPGWSLGMLVSDPVLASQARVPLVEKFATSNGGIDVSMVTYDPGS